MKGFLTMQNQIKRGEVYYCDLGIGYGSEQGGTRPCVVLQNDIGNKYSPTTLIAPLTTKKCHRRLPTHVLVAGNNLKPSVALLEQIKVIDRRRLRDFVTYLHESKMQELDNAIVISLGVTA
jgi:mRNA interferase MazF